MRRVIAALVVVGLVVAVILLWPSQTAEIPPDTLAGATTTTTSTSLTSTTTSSQTTTSTVGENSHVVETVEEAEEILRELWFGWFEGIYNQDEDRIRQVVVLEDTVETARESFGQMEFTQRPSLDLVVLDNVEILRSDSECLALWADLSVDAFREGTAASSGVHVLRHTSSGWRMLSVWTHKEDLWEADCDSEL